MPYDLPVECLVRPDIVACSPGTPIRQAAKAMSEAHCSSILVIDADQAVGIWTERDALAVDFADPSALDQPISRVMSSPVRTLPCKTSIGEAALHFKAAGIRHFLVVDDEGKRMGLLTQTDVIQNQGVEAYLSLKEVRSLLKGPPLELAPSLSLPAAARRMCEHAAEAVVADLGGELGILTERDIVRAISAGRADRTVGEIASRPLVSVTENASLYYARRLAGDRGIRHLGVTGRDGALIGILAFSDLLASAAQDYAQELRQALKDFTAKLDLAKHDLLLAGKVFETTLEGILITDAQGVIQSVNRAFTEITGYEPQEVTGKTPRVLSSGRHGAEFYRSLWAALLAEGRWQGEIWDRRKNGEVYPKWLAIRALRDVEGATTNYVATFSDISQRKRAEAALGESEERYRMLFNSSHDAIFLYALAPDGPGRFDEVNEMACQRLGYTRDELLGMTPCDIEADDCRGSLQAIGEKLRNERYVVFDTEHVAKDGMRIPVEVSVRLFDWNGAPHALAIARDVTERKQAEERIRRLAHFDALTNLPNRSLLLELLDQTLFEAKRYRRQFAVLFVDLDRFKQINDTLGHHAGDELLRSAADCLLESVRASDIVARFGGDEFVVVLTELRDARDAAGVAEKIVAAMTRPIALGAQTVSTTISVGIAIYPADGEEIGALVRKADAAMYRAKEAGRNGWSFAEER